MKCLLRILLLTCALCFTEAVISRFRKNTSAQVEDKCMLDESEQSREEVSVTVSGRICLPWFYFSSQYASFKNCHHNYCRNPDNKIQPWCFVKRKYRYVKEYCDMTHRKIKPTTMSPPTSDPSMQDTDKCMLDESEGSREEVSVTVRGRTCLPWFYFSSQNASFKNCHHNYCRNPDNKIQPWCFVNRRNSYSKQYCDMTHSKMNPTTMSPPTSDPSTQDTESTCGERNLNRNTKIIGGSRSTVESQPWIAAIFKGDGFICGGTLIAPCWVLTAAHCFPSGKRTSIKKYSVFLGKNAINDTDSVKEQNFSVSKLIVHEDYDYTTENYNNDIALLKIVNSNGQCAEKTNSVRTACLPPFRQMLPMGFYCEIAGYGRHQKGGFEYSRYLKQAQVKLISQNDCQNKYYSKDEVNENMLCAAGRDWQEDACQGDSGGPLVCEVDNTMFLFGIISWGKECSKELNPGVYTKVTNYNQWISQHTGLPKYTAGSRYPQKD